MVSLVKKAEAGEYRPKDGHQLLSDLLRPQTSQ
jgi:hypothetical protein